jgi:Tfp pilus assembly protein PilF
MKELMSQHQWEHVVNELDVQTLEISNNWQLYWNAGWSNFKLNQLGLAKEHFEKAVDLSGNSKDRSVCLTFLGIAELEDKNFENALEKLNEALALKDSILTRKSLALTLMNLNKVEAAEQVHIEGVSIEPSNIDRLAAYSDFLIDMDRIEEAEVIQRKIEGHK